MHYLKQPLDGFIFLYLHPPMFQGQPELLPSTPLTREQRDEFEQLLIIIDDDHLSFEWLEGYLAGVICCPGKLKTTTWFPPIWGEILPLDVLGIESVARFIDLVLQHFNHVQQKLQGPDGIYKPEYAVDRDETLWEIWAEGFAFAIEVGGKHWHKTDKLMARPGATETFTLLMGIVDLAMDGPLVPEEDRAEITKSAPRLIPQLVKNLYDLITTGKIPNGEELSVDQGLEFQKVGRNELCLCGSGKKYKKCHGA